MVFLEGDGREGGKRRLLLPWSGDVLGLKVAASIQEALAT